MSISGFALTLALHKVLVLSLHAVNVECEVDEIALEGQGTALVSVDTFPRPK